MASQTVSVQQARVTSFLNICCPSAPILPRWRMILNQEGRLRFSNVCVGTTSSKSIKTGHFFVGICVFLLTSDNLDTTDETMASLRGGHNPRTVSIRNFAISPCRWVLYRHLRVLWDFCDLVLFHCLEYNTCYQQLHLDRISFHSQGMCKQCCSI